MEFIQEQYVRMDQLIVKMDQLTQQEEISFQQQERIISLIEKIALKMEATEADNDRHFPSTRQQQTYSLEQSLPEDERIRRLKLYRSALKGKWETGEGMTGDIGVEISTRGDTILHIATAAKRIDFVREIMQRMNDNDLRKKNYLGQTALFLAAESGMVELAEELMKNNEEIAIIRDIFGTLPIYNAAKLGHKDMVNYLYQETINLLTEEDRKQVFFSAIETDLYDDANILSLDVALELLTNHPHLAIARGPTGDDKIGVTALHILAGKHVTFSKSANQNQGGNFKRFLNFGLGATEVANRKRQVLRLVESIWKKVVLLDALQISQLITKPRKLIFYAAKIGNVEFLSILIREYPDLVWQVDNLENNYSIFHIAIKNRQENVFKLIYELGATKNLIFMPKDSEGNNILHLAGKLAPPNRLTIIPGPSLQMKQELLWFKGVEKVFHPRYVDARNKEGLTPRELFTKQHEDLRQKGEKWMNNTARSCMVVATLITGVAFAAAITVPGGNNRDTGFPLFLEKSFLKIFAIFNAISLVSSSATILNFLLIFTSRFAEDDFLGWLPRKLYFGLATLLISLAMMLLVFSTTFFIFFNDGKLWIAILVTVIVSVPIIWLSWQYIQLFCYVYSTYVSEALFHQGESRLFPKEEEACGLHQKCKTLGAHLNHQCLCSTNV